MIHHGRQVLYGDLDQIRKAHSENAVVVRSNANYSRLPLVLTQTPMAAER